MEIAIGVIFLALFAGAFFLLVLITGFYFWRRSKRRSAEQNSQFTSAAGYGAVGTAADFDNDSDDSYFDSTFDSTNYSNTAEENKEANAGMSFDSPAEGGNYGSSEVSSTSYESSSGYESSPSYDSGSSYESSSSGSDSGSSSSSWD